MSLPKILVFASGSKDGGGSGFQNLVEASRDGRLKAEIVGVVSSRPEGGVRTRAEKLRVPFLYFPGPWTAERYQSFAALSGAQFFALSGWLKLVDGLDPNTPFNSRTVFNIHPGSLPAFGGKGMHGHHVHEAVMEAYKKGGVTHSCVTMHFVTEEYDKGPTFFRHSVPILESDTAESLGKRVNATELEWQPIITNMVANGEIGWDGEDPESLTLPPSYKIDHQKLLWELKV